MNNYGKLYFNGENLFGDKISKKQKKFIEKLKEVQKLRGKYYEKRGQFEEDIRIELFELGEKTSSYITKEDADYFVFLNRMLEGIF